MEKITDIIESIANEKNLDAADVKERVITAFLCTAKRLFGEEYEYNAHIDSDTKNIKLFQTLKVVADNDEQSDESKQFITLSKAKELDESVEIGDEINYNINIEDLGRTASMTLAKELNYHIQNLLREKLFEQYNSKIGNLVLATVTSIDEKDNTLYFDIDDLKGFMPLKNRIKSANPDLSDKFSVGDTVRAIIRRVNINQQGINIELSRTSPKFLEALLASEVPEIKDGKVIVKECARIPGQRAKVALVALSSSIDPIGAVVGLKGTRINAVSGELCGEIIDVIEYSATPEILVTRAMSPAIISSVEINEKKAHVFINPAQKSKAIGKNGTNVRLCSMITKYEIELHEIEEQKPSEEDALKNLQSLFKDI